MTYETIYGVLNVLLYGLMGALVVWLVLIVWTKRRPPRL